MPKSVSMLPEGFCPSELFRYALCISALWLVFIAMPVKAGHHVTVNLQLLWKHPFQFAGYYQAIEQGFYRDEVV